MRVCDVPRSVTAFTILRAPLEIYAAHESVKQGAKQTVILFGQRGVKSEIQVLWPDGRFTTHGVTLGATGKSSYAFTVRHSRRIVGKKSMLTSRT